MGIAPVDDGLDLSVQDELRQAGTPEPNPDVGSVPNTNDQIAALAAAVAQIQQAIAKQQLNTEIMAQAASSTLRRYNRTGPS